VERVQQLTALLVASVALLACSSQAVGQRVEARTSVHVTQEPLGDVVLDELRAGDRAVAECFVERARGNGGGTGSAVRVTSGRTTGYAAVTTSPADPADPADRRSVFDADEQALRIALPACAPRR